jgi:PIN domain nuclease of toxin-antitoxin system
VIVLDTHALVWWLGAEKKRLSSTALNTIDRELDTASGIENLKFLPVDNVVAVKSRFLPGEFHPDPADGIIVALARELACPLVTADEKIRSYPHVATIW